MLVSALAARLGPVAVTVMVPSLDDADAPLHTLLQVAARVGREAVASAEDGSRPLAARAEETVRGLKRDQVLLVHVPAGKGRPLEDDEPSRGWLRRLVLVAERHGIPSVRVVPPEHAPRRTSARLPLPRADLAALDAAALWGGYADHARSLGRVIGDQSTSLTPLQLRLMVGLVGLGAPPEAVVRQDLRGGQLVPLARMLVGLLASEALAEVRGAVRRLAVVRRPLPVPDALALARPPAGHEALLAHCIAYGDSELRVADDVRSVLLRKLARAADETPHHKAVADHHERLDGATCAVEALGGREPAHQVAHWLEKVHHLAHAGSCGLAEWNRQKLKSREFLIDRARSLSTEARDYEGAAAIYQRCLGLDPHDAYALHYRAYNLDREGGDAVEVERCYRAARDRQRTNLFYNSRLVTFFIEQGRPVDADGAWQAAQTNLAERLPEQVIHHVGLHVVRAWLEAGDVVRARHVFDSLPYEFEQDPRVKEAEQRLLDAEEAQLLGVAVYPPDVPVAERWQRPRVAPQRHHGAALQRWYPACIVSTGEEVVLALVTPHAEARQRRSFTRRLTMQEWRRMADWEPEDRSYLEIAEYGDQVLAFAVPTRETAGESRVDEGRPHPLRYLARSVEGSALGGTAGG